jgi:membrane protease YdiL (CAAX protease family)
VILRIVVFYTFAFVITLLLGGIQEGAHIPPEAIILPQLAPGASALLMHVIFRRDGDVVSFVGKGVPLSRYAMATVIPLVGALVAYLITALCRGVVSAPSTQASPWSLLLWIPIGAVGEELGWRGYLHNKTARSLNGLVSSLIVGVLWALWHVGLYQNGPLYMLFFVVLMVSYSVIIFALVHDIAFSVAIAAIFHVMINVTNLFSYTAINDVSFMAINSLVWATTAGILLVARRQWFMATASNL